MRIGSLGRDASGLGGPADPVASPALYPVSSMLESTKGS